MKPDDIQSMTGHAILETQVGLHSYRLQIKSVNHRFIELKFKCPRAWSSLELVVKQKLQASVKRGSIELWVEKIHSQSDASENQNTPQKFFSDLELALKKVRGVSQLLIPSPVRAVILAKHPEYWLKDTFQEGEWNAEIEKTVLKGMENLIAELVNKRHKEGLAILEVLQKILCRLEEHFAHIQSRIPEARKAWEEKLKARFKELSDELELKAVPEERVYSELLMLAEKRDVAEEMDRIQIHLTSLRNLLMNGDPHLGKRLDFLMQELHREWTTLGNKIQNAGLSPTVLEAKLNLEQIREQIQNLI